MEQHKGWSLDTDTNLQAALSYAARGWPVFPLHWPIFETGKCSCGKLLTDTNDHSPAKHPRIKAWQKNASADQGQIILWWSHWPNANIGIATGKGGRVIVVDVDGAEGAETLRQLIRANGQLQRTATVKTARGFHFYYTVTPEQAAGIHNSSGGGLDIRGEGGYVVAPPSLHASGHQYQWVEA